jgi:tetratricopeptide (TPR) repeat protein/two-component sensor histidine kinase
MSTRKKNTVHLIFLILIGLSASMRGYAQSSKIDSIQNKLLTAKPDSNKVKLLIKLSTEYFYPFNKGRIDLALSINKSAKSLADSIHYKAGQLTARENEAYIYTLKLRIDSAIVLYRQLLPDARQFGELRLLAEVEKGLGTCLVKHGEMQEGRKYLYAAIVHARASKKTEIETRALLDIGLSYLFDEQYSEGFDTVLIAYERFKQANSLRNMSFASSVLASHYCIIKQYNQALFWSKVGLSNAYSLKDSSFIVNSLLDVGEIFTRIQQPDSAEYYLTKALQSAPKDVRADQLLLAYYNLSLVAALRKDDATEFKWLLKYIDTEKNLKSKFPVHSFDVKILLGLYYLKKNRLSEARTNFEEAIKIAEKWQNWYALSEGYSGLSQIAERTGQTKEAFKYYKLHIAARDSLFNEENTRKLTQVEMTHEFSQKQALVKAAQDRELALRDAQSQQQRLLFIVVLLGLMGAVAFGFYTYSQRQERRRTELELANLRAQINPHFIFNCLNSIYRYTKERDTDTAAKYLQKFSSLLRLVLENSRTEKITLARDLEALQLYVDIEALRFKEKLQFSLEIDPEIDPTFLQIPGMLIQPHVENAIWHGLMHRESGGRIAVRVTQTAENLLRVEVEDNGIGRAAAEELESKSALTKKSLGQKITAERLKSTGKLAHIETIDLTEVNGQAAGTKVVMEIQL